MVKLENAVYTVRECAYSTLTCMCKQYFNLLLPSDVARVEELSLCHRGDEFEPSKRLNEKTIVLIKNYINLVR